MNVADTNITRTDQLGCLSENYFFNN